MTRRTDHIREPPGRRPRRQRPQRPPRPVRVRAGTVHRHGRCPATSARSCSTTSSTRRTPGPRERFEAVARSLRDLLTQRWLKTQQELRPANPKQVYYLSMEFLIGRSLANNIINLSSSRSSARTCGDQRLGLAELVEQEPDAGLGNGGLGRLAACFIDSLATLQIPAIGYGLRYEYGIFRQEIANGYQVEQPDNWLRRPDPWEVARPDETVTVPLGSSFELHGGQIIVAPGQPTHLLGVPYDRPVVGYGGRTINTLRLWQAASPGLLRLRRVQQRRLLRRGRPTRCWPRR